MLQLLQDNCSGPSLQDGWEVFAKFHLHPGNILLSSCQRGPSSLLPIAEPCIFIYKKWLKFYFLRLNKPSSSDRLLGDKFPIFPVAQAACLCSGLSLTFASGDDQNQTKPPKWEPSGLILPSSPSLLKIIRQIYLCTFCLFFFPRWSHHFRGSLTFCDWLIGQSCPSPSLSFTIDGFPF